MSEVNAWSATASSNNSAAPDGAPEGMDPGDVNNVAREMMAVLKRWQADTNGSITSGGSSNAYTLAVNRTTTAAYAGEEITFKANHTNTSAVTVNITPSGGSARGTVAVQGNGIALAAGEIVSGAIVTIRYDGTQYQLVAPVALNRANTWSAAQTFSAGIIFGNETMSAYDEVALTLGFTPQAGSVTAYTSQAGKAVRIGSGVIWGGTIEVNTLSV